MITGASGFLGRAVMRACRESGLDCLGLTRGEARQAGMLSLEDYSQAPDGEVLIHLAETNDMSLVQKKGEAYLTEATGLVSALLAKGYSRVIYASSAAVYGDQGSKPYSEKDATAAKSIYTESKLACEQLVLRYGGVVLRLANLYGPGMSSANVLSDILSQIPGQGPLKVRDQSAERDFIWVDDAARAFCLAATDPDCSGVFNVGSGRATSIARLAKYALEAAGEPLREVISTSPGGSYSRNALNNQKIRNHLGWQPEVELREGLSRMLDNLKM